MKKFIRVLVFSMLISMNLLTVSHARSIFETLSKTSSQTSTQTSSTTSYKTVDGFYMVETDSYLNTVEPSTVVLPEEFREMAVDGYSLVYNDEFIPAEITLNKNIMSITPSGSLKDGATYQVRIFAGDDSRYAVNLKAYNLKSIDFSRETVVKIPANPERGFNYPYYLVIPRNADKSEIKRLIVEPNNSGMVSDVLDLHAELAKAGVTGASQSGWVSEMLQIPALMPVFPRPLQEWWDNYYHTLSREVMLQTTGDGVRVDLQLIAMIKDAQELLAANGLEVEKKVFMTGFSASGQFVNRFTVLHPEWVKAVFAGGFTMYPAESIDGNILYFPLGIADIKEIAGKEFNLEEYKKVAQFVFTGDLDRNDRIVETEEDYNAYDAKVMYNLYKTEDCMIIWKTKERLINDLGFGENFQFHIYEGIGHGIPSAASHDILEFFMKNNGDEIVKINAHKDAGYWNPEELPKPIR